MKTKILLLFVLGLVLCNTSLARIFRIGHTGTSIAGVDYAYNNMSAAITAATNGDTIQLYQQYWPGSQNQVTINKRLVIIGFGYMLDKNAGLQALNAPDNNYVQFLFSSGAEGSIVEGAYGYFYINANNINIRRSRIILCYLYDNLALKDVTISQSFINNIQEYYQTNGVENLVLRNNYIGSAYLPHSSGMFTNNVVNNSPNLYSFLVKNNVFDGCITGGVNIIQNNLFSTTCAVGSGTNNKFDIDMSSVFVNWNNGNILADSQLVVKAGSAAINAGIKNDNTATNAGYFGGENGQSYRLSGIPSVPSVYKLTAPSQTANTNPYVITVSVRSNN